MTWSFRGRRSRAVALAVALLGGASGALVVAAPSASAATVTSISPTSGGNVGAAFPITAQGTFVGVTKVALTRTGFPEIVGKDVTSSATSVTATFDLRGRAPGAWSFVVTDSQGASSPRTFTVVGGAPTITSVSPAVIRQDSTPTVTITGTNLFEGAGVVVTGPEPGIGEDADVAQEGVTTYQPDGKQIVVRLAVAEDADTTTGATGSNPRDVTVTNTDGQDATKADAISVIGALVPTVTDVDVAGEAADTPSSPATSTFGQGAIDLPVQLVGRDFAKTGATVAFTRPTVQAPQGATEPGITTKIVSAGGCAPDPAGGPDLCTTLDVLVSVARTVATSSPSQVRPRDLSVNVANPDGSAGTSAPLVNVVAAPTITGVSPAGATSGGTAQVTVSGSFPSGDDTVLQLNRPVANTAITLTGVTLTEGGPGEDDTLRGTANLAGAPAGPYDVVATNASSDKGRDVEAGSFTVAGPTPTLTSASPNQLVAGRTVTLTLTGTGFSAGTTVGASGTGLTFSDVVVTSPTSLTVKVVVAESAATGARTLTLTTPDGQGASCASCLTVLPRAATTYEPFGSAWKGGVAVGSGQVDPSSATLEIISGAGPGGGPNVQVHAVQGGTPKLVASWFAYPEGFRGGVRVAAGDVTGDGRDEVITAPGRGGGPNVRVWSVDPTNGKVDLLASFFAYDQRFDGGVTVAFGRVDPSVAAPQIVTGAGAGAGPHVRAFGVLPTGIAALGGGFFAYDPAFRGGVNVATADLDGDGTQDYVTDPQAAGPNVRVHRGSSSATPQLLASYFAVESSFNGGLTIATGKVLEGAGPEQVIVGTGVGRTGAVRLFTGLSGTPAKELTPATGTGGFNVAAGDVEVLGGEAAALEEVIVGDLSGGGRVFVIRA